MPCQLTPSRRTASKRAKNRVRFDVHRLHDGFAFTILCERPYRSHNNVLRVSIHFTFYYRPVKALLCGEGQQSLAFGGSFF
jgi:hypothetical protein